MSDGTAGWKFDEGVRIFKNPIPDEYEGLTVEEARGRMEVHLKAGESVKDPVTGRPMQIYVRKLTPPMITVFLAVYHAIKTHGEPHVLGSQISNIARGGDYGKLRFWGLLQQVDRPGVRASAWTLGPKAEDAFMRGRELPARVLVFQDRRIGEIKGVTVKIESFAKTVDLEALYRRLKS